VSFFPKFVLRFSGSDMRDSVNHMGRTSLGAINGEHRNRDVGVAGAGTMGSGIAQVFAQADTWFTLNRLASDILTGQ